MNQQIHIVHLWLEEKLSSNSMYMASKSKIKIISKLSPEFSSNITVDNISYNVLTEDWGTKTCIINTSIYLKGEIVFSKKYDYSHLTKQKDFNDKIMAVMEKQHKSAMDNFISEQSKKKKSKSDYFEEVQRLLKRGKGKLALNTIRKALENFPLDPFLLSYYGCLVAIVENNPKNGIKICKYALTRLGNTVPFGSEFYYPVFYLNLGRAYLKGNKRKEAVIAFKKGLRNDPENSDLLGELEKLGIRRKLPLPLLNRSNPINKYIGLLLSRIPR